MRTLTIGNVVLDNPYILAPMAGVTDLPFRLLCREQVVPGPTEMVQINNPQGALTLGHPHHQTHGLLTRRAS